MQNDMYMDIKLHLTPGLGGPPACDDFDVAGFRRQFPSLPSLAYFNSGSYGLLSERVRDAFQFYLQSRIKRGADWSGWIGALEELRATIATLLEVDGDEIAITGSASAGINALASALAFRPGKDAVLVSDFEFPPSAQIWHAQAPAGARIVQVPEDGEGRLPLAHFAERLGSHTAPARAADRRGGKECVITCSTGWS